jgi:hypothetical protein
MLYYILGLLQILLVIRAQLYPVDETLRSEEITEFSVPPLSIKSLFQAGGGFVILSIIVSFAPGLIPDQFPPLTSLSKQTYFEEIAESSDLTIDQVQQFSSAKGAIIQAGKVLYPRFYYPDEGIFHYRSEVVDYPRVEFTLINDGVYQVRIPIGNGRNFLSHEMDVVVIGCLGQDSHIEGLVIFPFKEADPEVMIRNTGWAETCPLPTP